MTTRETWILVAGCFAGMGLWSGFYWFLDVMYGISC